MEHTRKYSIYHKDPAGVRDILGTTKTLEYPLGERLPLFLWPAHDAIVEDELHQRQIVENLIGHGVAVISKWQWKKKEKTLADGLRVARIQKDLGLHVCIDATRVMYGFFNGDSSTAHLDDQGNPFFDSSIPSGRIGCPFRIDHRYESMRKQIEFFVSAYEQAGLQIDMVWGDWEIDGPLEINRAWEAAKRCAVCRKRIQHLDKFEAFQDAVRVKRAEATRLCYTDPILSRFPSALVGNYAVYPHDGFRYWYDYFEDFIEYHPHHLDQLAPCRRWHHEFELTKYTFAMPVVYPWARLYGWYNYENSDFRWFYNMLRVGSNAAAHTRFDIPLIPFVHYQTIYEPDPGDPTIKQMSTSAYQELLWHLILRGCDSLFLWCLPEQNTREVPLIHKVWAESLRYTKWLNKGIPITFDVPNQIIPVISGLRVGNQVLVRRTDFNDTTGTPVQIRVADGMLTVPADPGQCQILGLDACDA